MPAAGGGHPLSHVLPPNSMLYDPQYFDASPPLLSTFQWLVKRLYPVPRIHVLWAIGFGLDCLSSGPTSLTNYSDQILSSQRCLLFKSIFVNFRHRMISAHKMRPVATDGVAWSACLLATFVSPTKRLNRSRCRLGTTRVGPRNHIY